MRDVRASLTIPSGAYIVSGVNPVYLGYMEAGDSRIVYWRLIFTADGVFDLDVTASGYSMDTGAYEERTGSAIVTVHTPVVVLILHPQNSTYPTSEVPLIFTVNENASWIGYSLDGQANVTITENSTLTSLLNGQHHVVVFASDTAGNVGASKTVFFTVQDITSPNILIVSPANKTYAIIGIRLIFTLDESVSWMAYSLDGEANVTISGNTTLPSLTDGSYSIVVYASDTYDNIGASNRAYFSFERQHDVAAINIKTSLIGSPKTIVGQGYNASVYVNVENQGSFTETFNVTAYSNASIVGDTQVTLMSGENITLAFTWETIGFVDGNYTLSAYAWPVQDEIDTSDNTIYAAMEVCVTVPGDVDADFGVDLYDAVKLLSSYGAKEGGPNYDPNLDINGNGQIYLFDAVILLIHYGQGYP